MDFSEALKVVKAGGKIRRSGWNVNQWVALEEPSIASVMNVPYLYVFTNDGFYIPWMPTTTDLLAEDWQKLS